MRLLTVTAAVLTSLTACVSEKAPIEEDFSDLAALDDKSDAFSYRLKLLGELTDGAAPRALYKKAPRFRGYTFTAFPGDQVDVWVRSTQGDPVAWILDGRFRVIASNDDADDTTYDAHMVATLPASGTALPRYHVVYRDYDLGSHYFTVHYDHEGAVADDSWEEAARAKITQLVLDYSPLAPMATSLASLPAAARARHDASAAVLEVPTTYRVDVAGEPVYLVLATDGSGEGNTVVVDLVDGAGRWFAHGMAHTLWDGGGDFSWTQDPVDPTMCGCVAAGEPATCTWMDGTTSTSTRECE